MSARDHIHITLRTGSGRAPTLRHGLLLAPLLLLGAGCPKICNDDGFAWQQQADCLLAADESTGGATDTAESSGTAVTDEPTTSGGAGKWCVDSDMDGFGDPNKCSAVPPGEDPPQGSVENDDDCDDQGPDTFPGAAPKDDPDACMKDSDGDDRGDMNPPGGVMPGSDCDDGLGSAWASCGSCTDADGDGAFVGCDEYPPEAPTADCDDGEPNTFPGAAPNDDAVACMTDADGDDWGDDKPSDPAAIPGTDCDDASATTFPGAAPSDDANACMNDDDDDDHGDANPGAPGVMPGSDCFDTNADLNPGATALITAPINSGEITEIDPATGSTMQLASVDVSGIVPWIPTSVAVHPIDGSIYVALAFTDRLATMNYCGAGTPTLLPGAHKKNICGIDFDRDGNLYGIDGQVDQLLTFQPDGSLGPGGAKSLTYTGKTLNVADCGMAYDCHEDRLLVSDSGSASIYSVNVEDAVLDRLVALAGEKLGSGLAYDPTTRRALSCDQTSFYSIAIDGSGDFTQLPDLDAPADDLDFGPDCE